MRLHVSVKRYSLPTTNIIFTTNALGPSPATSSTDATIAQLLEDINDIVPLESGDWGFEDYAVEVNGYECLHFSPIDAVLRDNDQVVIRALKTQDLRSRRLGGRHQISSDGRHLIDGVAFGRQWLMKGGRPAVQLPPRKRRFKIEGAEDREEEEAKPLALTGPEHADEQADGESDEVEDSDFVDEDADTFGGESDGKLGSNFMIATEPSLQIVARQEFLDADDEAQDSSEEGESDEDSTDDDLSVEDAVEDAEVELSAELQALHEEEHWHSSKVNGKGHKSANQTSPNGASDLGTVGRKRKRTVDYDVQVDDGDDFNGFSSPLIKRSKADEDYAAPDSDSKSTSSSSSDSDEDSESEASIPPSSDSSEETSSSDSESGNEAESEDETSGSSSSSSQTSDIADSNGETDSKIKPERSSIVSQVSLPTVTSGITTRPPVPPGQGLRRTHYTNQRQKKRHRLAALKEQGLLPENATFADMAAYDEAQKTSSLGAAAAVAQVIEAKKRELLGQVGEHMKEQLTEQTTEQDPYVSWEATEKRVHSAESTTRRPEASFIDNPSQSLRGPDTPSHERTVQDLIGPLPAAALETKSEPPKRRARLDLDSTRNMIFNGLGVRKPKTEAAEQALREKLAKPVKGALPKQLFKDPVTKQDGGSARPNDSQIPWQSKLVLSAVECELEGVALKEPPFPFVQGWDEDANQRLRNNKKKGRNDRQYYAYDDATVMDGYGVEYEEVQDQDDSMLYPEVNGHDKLDQLTTQASNLIDEARNQLDTKASNLIDEARSQLDTKASNLSAEDSEDLPRLDNVDSLDELQQQDALPGAVIAYKEFHLNETSFQPEVSGYRVALVEAVREDGGLDLRISKRDRKPAKVAKYDEETGERILSRSEMWEGSDDAAEDDGSRLMSYADLIEPKIVQVSTTSKSAASMSLRGGGEVPKGTAPSAPESAVTPELTVSDSFALISGQPPSQNVTEADTKIDIATPRRTEISTMMKEAGFNSTLDSELLRPLDGTTDSAPHVSTGLDVSEGSRNQSRKTSADPTSEAQQTAPDLSEFESPRFNGWSSSPAIEPEPDEATEVTGIGEPRDSSQNEDIKLEGESVGNGSSVPKNDVTYPHISQLEFDASIQESAGHNLSGDDVPTNGESSKDLEDALPLDNSAADFVEETHLDSLKSMVPSSVVDESQEAGEPQIRNGHATATFLGGSDGQTSSNDDELPSLARITATARSQSSREWPPPRIRRGKAKATRQRRSPSPLVKATASGSQPPMKQSQSQVSLSQVPPGAQVVDLTFSSDPVSPGNSDGDYTRTNRLSFSSNKAKAGSIGAGAPKNEASTAGTGLGNRRLLKSKKAKP